MKYSNKRFISVTIFVFFGAFFLSHITDVNGQEITKEKLLGVWWTYDSDDIPWAIQFNEDNTFRTAHTLLRLQKIPKDTGRYELKKASLSLISDKNCNSPCRGLKGNYTVELTKYQKLRLNVQNEQCEKRKTICSRSWSKTAD